MNIEAAVRQFIEISDKDIQMLFQKCKGNLSSSLETYNYFGAQT